MGNIAEPFIADFEASRPKLAELTDAQLIELAEHLAPALTSWLRGPVLNAVPAAIAARGPAMVPLLEAAATTIAADPRAPRPLGLMVAGPLARLLADQGRVPGPEIDQLLARAMPEDDFFVARFLGALPPERRLALARLSLLPDQGRSGMPYATLEACPAPEVIRWTFSTVAAWKRDRDAEKKRQACAQLLAPARSFARAATGEVIAGLSADLGPYRWPFVRALGDAADGPAAIDALIEELLGKGEVATSAEQALVELSDRFPEELRERLEAARGSKRRKMALLVYRVFSLIEARGKQA